jgi:uncharacterized membrane protein YeaQ/YmgE (transglycosylase-associated protein family)
MILLAAVQLSPGFGFVGWVIIGLLAGAIAGRIVRGRGMGCLADIVVGVIGAIVGGLILSQFYSGGQTFGFIGSLLVATVGAVLLLVVWRVLTGAFR